MVARRWPSSCATDVGSRGDGLGRRDGCGFDDRRSLGWAVPRLGHPVGRQVRGGETRVSGHESVERQGGLDAGDLGLVEGAPEAVDGGEPVAGVDHDLGDQVVVVGRDAVALPHPGVDADARAFRHDPVAYPPRAGGEVAGRVLGGQPNLDGMTHRRRRPVRGGQDGVRQRSAGRQAELLRDDVEAA